MQNKKLQVWLPVLFSLVMISGMLIGYKIKTNMPNKGIFFIEQRKPLQEIIKLIEDKYVDEQNPDSLSDAAIDAILARLDPHSIYLPASQLQESKEQLQGGFYGIGVEYNIFKDTIHVLNVIKDGPADKAGIRIGDKFLKVGDSAVAGVKITIDKIKFLLRGGSGSKVDIILLRGDDRKKISITRGMIPLHSLDAAYMMSNTIGYIRLNKFSETTYKEFMDATINLQKHGMLSMILDLRDNGGGILTEATNIADEFLDGDKLITYTKGRKFPRKEYRSQKEGIFEKGKVVVLANESSASASEVLIGALQDWDRATIIGRRTFGKGLVQEQFELSDGSGLRLTVARYYTPLGRSIQKSYSNGSKAYREELLNRYNSGELLSADSVKHTGTAYQTKSGKTLYGGGGIDPDIFVPFDTTGISKNAAKIYTLGTIYDFTYRNYLANKDQFKTYNSPMDFEKKYFVDEQTWSNFKAFAARDSVNLNYVSAKEKAEISKQIKILLARQIWRTEGLFKVSNAEDPIVKKALEVLSK